jgi:hypothetical protein
VAENSVALMELVEKYADADLLRKLGQWVLQRLIVAPMRPLTIGIPFLVRDEGQRRNGPVDPVNEIGLKKNVGVNIVCVVRLELRPVCIKHLVP